MAQQVLDTVGATDSLKTGGNKINANFTELYGDIATINANLDGLVGNINNPLTQIPFKRANDETRLSGTQTYTRSTTGSYYDALDGLLKSAAIDTRRFERMADGGVGLLLETASTNILTYSEQLDVAPWAGASTVVSNDATAPDGTLTMDKITCAGSQTNSRYRAASGLNVGQTYTISFHLKGVAGEKVFIGTNATQKLVTFTGAIQREDVQFVAISGNNYLNLETYDRGGMGGHLPGVTFHAWGAQLEQSGSVSSYLATTTTSVTRAADSLTIPVAGNMVGVSDNMTIIMDVEVFGATTMMDILSVTGETYRLIRMNAGYLHLYHGTSVVQSTSAVYQARTVHRVCMVIDGTNTRGFVDGVQVSTGAQETPVGSATSITIGGSMLGHIRNLRIYDIAMTDSEIASA